jgi:hypothetical protein
MATRYYLFSTSRTEKGTLVFNTRTSADDYSSYKTVVCKPRNPEYDRWLWIICKFTKQCRLLWKEDIKNNAKKRTWNLYVDEEELQRFKEEYEHEVQKAKIDGTGPVVDRAALLMEITNIEQPLLERIEMWVFHEIEVRVLYFVWDVQAKVKSLFKRNEQTDTTDGTDSVE